jgi:DNA ligase-1
MTLLATVVDTSRAVGATRARREKIELLAGLLRACSPDEIEPVVGFLTGEPRQGRIGVGWASAYRTETQAATASSLQIADLDHAIDELAGVGGTGSQARRASLLDALMARATAGEQQFIRSLLTGELRQGALAGILAEAVARAADVAPGAVRRAAMLAGDLGAAASSALTGGEPALMEIGLHVLRPVQPMLAGSAASVAEALEATGPASVEWKLDGARVQVHRAGDDVGIFTRNLNDITARLPHLVEHIRGLAVRDAILDGEIIGLAEEGERPHRFQDTMSTLGTRGLRGAAAAPAPATTGSLQVFFFDLLHVDGDDLLDAPLSERRAALERIGLEGIDGLAVVPALVTADAGEAGAFAAGALRAGHEGVMVKALDAPYHAGRRGKAWRKVKPVRTADLVVLAAEWGHGRRRGWLSNLHLGARAADGSFVMVGKTFKGLTDALLAWQTEQLQSRALGEEGIVVHVRPELVVEIAFDGVQVSRRYPGGVALRFARVRRYRDDKTAADADRIEALQELVDPGLSGEGSGTR